MMSSTATTFPDKEFKACTEQMIYLLHESWLAGLFSAANGNASLRLPEPYTEFVAITASGTYKGHLTWMDISLLQLKDNSIYSGASLSSETSVHRALYEETECRAVLHSHPPKLIALDIISTSEKTNVRETLSQLPHFEARMWSGYLGYVGPYPPGSTALADAVKSRAAEMRAENEKNAECGCIWMAEHGLTAWGRTLEEAMALSEEMEHLAEIALLVHSAQRSTRLL